MTASKSHNLVLLSERSASSVEVGGSKHSGVCAKHSNEPLRLYCLKCNVCVCVTCVAYEHNEHKYEEIKTAFTKYLGQFDVNIAALEEALKLGLCSIEKLKFDEDTIEMELSTNEQNIRERCDALRKIVDRYEEELLCEARKFRDQRVKEFRSHLDEFELHCAQLESSIRYLKKLREEGSTCSFEVACNGKELETRTEHIVTASRTTFTKDLSRVHLIFIPDDKITFLRQMLGQFVTGGALFTVVGLDTGVTGYQRFHQIISQISLDKQDVVQMANSSITNVDSESSAVTVNNDLYVVGISNGKDELWKWSATKDEWSRCADMTSGRRRHCVTSVGDKIYVLGGCTADDKKVLDSILCYDITSKKWSEAGQLCPAVHSATCVTYKQCIYIFGGNESGGQAVDYVQVYNPSTGKISSSRSLPTAQSRMRAAIYRSKALLIGRAACYIYDFESDTWQQRMGFQTGVDHFGLAVTVNTLYIVGGGSCTAEVWSCRDDVKSLSVEDFLSDNIEAEWKHYATLSTPALIHSFSSTPIYK